MRSIEPIEPGVPGYTHPEVLGFIAAHAEASGAVCALEIGSYMGRSAFAICTGLRARRSTDSVVPRVVCIDRFSQRIGKHAHESWYRDALALTSPDLLNGYREPPAETTLGDLFDRVLDVHPFMGPMVSAKDHDSQSLSSLDGIVEDGVGLAFVDGDHTWEGVLHDVRLVLTKLAPGGLLLLDDDRPAFPGVQRLVRKLGSASAVDRIGDHGGVVAFCVRDALAASDQLARA